MSDDVNKDTAGVPLEHLNTETARNPCAFPGPL